MPIRKREDEMDWFERLTGFGEQDYATTRQNLDVDGTQLHSLVNGASYGIGEFELVSLRALRERVQHGGGMPGKLRVRAVSGDVRAMHRMPEYAGALFQVASQFNMLEMVSEDVTPEHGVTGYEHDHTQGPGCACYRLCKSDTRRRRSPMEAVNNEGPVKAPRYFV